MLNLWYCFYWFNDDYHSGGGENDYENDDCLNYSTMIQRQRWMMIMVSLLKMVNDDENTQIQMDDDDDDDDF